MSKKNGSRRTWEVGCVTVGIMGALGIGLASMLLASGPAEAAGATGVISGKVTADKGKVQALRVQARDTVNRVTYTVFTVGGEYHIYNLPPAEYEVSVLEEEFKSPRPLVKVAAGKSENANLELEALKPLPAGKGVGLYEQQGKTVDLVDFDTLYPAGPGRDILVQKCFGCHSTAYDNHWHRMPGRTKAEWGEAFKRMYDPETYNKKKIAEIGAPPMLEYPLLEEDKDTLLTYLATNFGPGHPERDYKLDTVVRNEDALSKVQYVTYYYPAQRGSHDVFPSAQLPGTLWGASIGSGYITAVNTGASDPAARYREWEIPNPENHVRGVHPHGVIECKDKIYWTGMADDTIGEMDIKTGAIIRHVMPTRGGGSHTARADSKCNVWATQVYGQSRVVRMDAKTKEMKDWVVLAGANWYGITVDQKDRPWAASYGAPAAAMFDLKTEQWKVYELSHGIRRITVDPDGKVWGNQYFGNNLVKIDPDTGAIKYYELPVKLAAVYESISDAQGNQWAESQPYNGLFKLNPKTTQWTYYPNPVLRGHTPKMEVDEHGDIWYSMQGALMTLKPNGNVPAVGTMKAASNQ